jgi:hypothetical protein
MFRGCFVTEKREWLRVEDESGNDVLTKYIPPANDDRQPEGRGFLNHTTQRSVGRRKRHNKTPVPWARRRLKKGTITVTVNPRMSWPLQPPGKLSPVQLRDAAIGVLWEAGVSYREIGEKLGWSKNRAQRYIEKRLGPEALTKKTDQKPEKPLTLGERYRTAHGPNFHTYRKQFANIDREAIGAAAAEVRIREQGY